MIKKYLIFSLLFFAYHSQAATLSQKPGGLQGYISANITPPTEEFGYGVSYYSHVWPLIQVPLANFQIGLPSSWLTPNNNNFTQPLCPQGTFARDHWPQRGPYYRYVFQTIEGGLGFWNTTQFASLTPKYRMNGTPDCYTNQISSPGWAFGKTASLPSQLMGIAQLSNHILIPPDGLTFSPKSNDDVLGIAWMALPISPNTTSPSPTGDQSWTLFLNAGNFAGPVAFYLPNNWSRLSQTYTAIAGRGLDAQPAIMNSSSMEINSVPYFEAQDASGTTFSRIPRIQFPVDENGQTKLMQDIYFYSKQALYSPLKNALTNNTAIPTQFEVNDAKTATCKGNPINLTQKNIHLSEINSKVETFTALQNGSCLFGLQWKNIRNGFAIFPAYFKAVGQDRVAITESEVPAETNLKSQIFKRAVANHTYQRSETSTWGHDALQKDFHVTLMDGSTLTYRWYKFVDQPSLQHLNLNNDQKNKLQGIIVELQKSWTNQAAFMPVRSSGNLVQLDPTLLVTPPRGFEYGFVPIVLKQGK